MPNMIGQKITPGTSPLNFSQRYMLTPLIACVPLLRQMQLEFCSSGERLKAAARSVETSSPARCLLRGP
jgi:hypothetical protein